jgi:adenine C2-methylase RlmN of 23S rRNA A2503 and tRNA A37
LADGERIETVLLNPKPNLWSCCISSEVGCPLACRFCATGKMGFVRRLSAEEITDQVLFWQQYIQREMPDVRLRNVVYMGMGEPLHNPEAVFDSLRELTNTATFGFGARHLSLSTVGIVPEMERFTDRFPQVNLAVSLHAAAESLRTRLVPINRKYPLKLLGKAVEYHLRHTHRKVFLEYVLLDGVNDADPQAHRLADFVHMFSRPALLHVNLITCHPGPGKSSFEPPPGNRVRVFHAILLERGVKATIRKSLGSEIAGACGQLAVRAKQ